MSGEVNERELAAQGARLEMLEKSVASYQERLNGNLEKMWTSMGQLERDMTRHFNQIQDHLNRRLPVWATMFLAFLTGLCSVLAAIVAMHIL